MEPSREQFLSPIEKNSGKGTSFATNVSLGKYKLKILRTSWGGSEEILPKNGLSGCLGDRPSSL